MIVNRSNLIRKMIKITWEINIFSKKDNGCIVINNSLKMEE
jgi:ssDNA-specific exonuclease RecJ